MAYIVVTWQCGHEDNIRTRPRDAEYWESRAAREICRECWHDQQNQEAAEAAKAQALPELKGTPKQIAWAETLRQAMLTQVAELEAKIPAGDPKRPDWDRLVRKLRIQSHASWWIDRRGRTPLEIFRHWETERREAERAKPVAELLGETPPPAPQPPRPAVGFQAPQAPAEPLRPAAHHTSEGEPKPPVAGYDPDRPRHLEIDPEEPSHA
jgi:hypothetical protein